LELQKANWTFSSLSAGRPQIGVHRFRLYTSIFAAVQHNLRRDDFNPENNEDAAAVAKNLRAR
jgi:hypothetical protein